MVHDASKRSCSQQTLATERAVIYRLQQESMQNAASGMCVAGSGTMTLATEVVEVADSITKASNKQHKAAEQHSYFQLAHTKRSSKFDSAFTIGVNMQLGQA